MKPALALRRVALVVPIGNRAARVAAISRDDAPRRSYLSSLAAMGVSSLGLTAISVPSESSVEPEANTGVWGWLSWAFCGTPTSGYVAANTARDTDSATKPPSVTLYEYQPCPFCNKVKAFLDYTDTPWTSVEVDPLFKKEIAFSQVKPKKVPICIIDETQTELNDSSVIIKTLLEHVPRGGKLPHIPTTPADVAEEEKWRLWVDAHLVHLLTSNIYRTWDESLMTFDYLLTHGNFPVMQRTAAKYFGAVIMFGLCEYKLNKKYCIVHPREELYESITQFISAVGPHKFLGQSDKPTVADLAVFGVLRAIRDYPTFSDLMENTNASSWYQNVELAVGMTSKVTKDCI